ncbi:PREDICTED: gamma-glutamyltranspeptidase 1-like [Branchiostoma belcheri]|uniref:Glutathione hydrolase n=1 Tax=Branchiostoma belcheri TaxID=7741 RepID=A0A6P4ZBK8_BRABE|nr:PREDICTED: gamma-glutamyltranspeptidase 1-like [Branchiostoma belcheri]
MREITGRAAARYSRLNQESDSSEAEGDEVVLYIDNNYQGTRGHAYPGRPSCCSVCCHLLASVILILVATAFGLPAWKAYHGQLQDGHHPHTGYSVFKHAAVATDSSECSQIGADILEKRGGSAVDAAIAALYCLGIKHPHSAGIGGGLFFVIYDRSRGAAEVIDAREVAPAAATMDMFGDNRTLSQVGGLAVAVPGAVKGHMEAHQRYGKLPWGDLLQPAIELARSGTTVDKALAHALKSAEHKVKASPLQDVFCDQDGNVLTEGKKYKMSDLSRTLDSIARHGGDVFYSGNIATNLVTNIQSQGGIIAKDDFENYRVNLTRPKYSELKTAGLRMISTGPPGGGAVFEFILKTLEEFELNPKSVAGEDLAITLHKIAEVFKFAAAERTHLGDPRFENVADEVAKLTSDSFAEEIMRKIKNHGHHTSDDSKGYYGAQFYNADDAGTTHVSVLAANGDAVAVTSTINHYFGSGVYSPSTGVILNNEMSDLSSPGFHRNDKDFPPYSKKFYQVRKRPMSSTCPTIMIDRNQNVQVVMGASGGMMIPTAAAQVFANMEWFGMDMLEAVDSGRIHHQLEPNELYMERKLWNNHELVHKLSHWDYNPSPTIYDDGSYAAVQVIWREGAEIQACSDPRKGGKPAGY